MITVTTTWDQATCSIVLDTDGYSPDLITDLTTRAATGITQLMQQLHTFNTTN